MFKSTGHAQFDKLLEKATSNLLLEPDWGSIIMICDLIRQKDCQAKYAVSAIKKKLHHQNPHVAMFGLQVLESVVKNCGSPVHDEVASKQFMEELRELTKTTHHENVKDKVLELILTWAHAFRKISSYRAVQDVVNIMKAEGIQFKPLQESDAMFVADTAPEWADGECCHRCRTEFSLVTRKHHCRACGQIFCGKCSSKVCTLPKFGIEKEVRVCDSCFEKYGKDGSASDPDELIMRATQPQLRQPPAQTQGPNPNPAARTKTEEELQEEEQLQLALAISQSEAEAKEMEKKKRGMSAYSYPPAPDMSANNSERDRNHEKSSPQKNSENEDPELAKYLNRGYWENRSKEENSREETGGKTVSAAVEKAKTWNSSSNYSFIPSAPINENKDKAEQAEEIDTFVENLRSQIEMFVNRMKSNSSRGRSIAYDTSVQGLFMNITALHSQLLTFIQAQDDGRTYYEGLQDKLGQIRDARAALDDLRREHAEKLRQQAEEQERIRQFQMAQKLQIMRQKKAEYLQYQRQLAMQRMQEQEREMQMRIEQQTRAMGSMPSPYPGYPPNMVHGMPPGYMPQMPDMNYMQQQQQHPGMPHASMPGGPMQGPPSSMPMGQPGAMPMGPYPGQYMPGPVPGQMMPVSGPPQQQGPEGMPPQSQPMMSQHQHQQGPQVPYQGQQDPGSNNPAPQQQAFHQQPPQANVPQQQQSQTNIPQQQTSQTNVPQQQTSQTNVPQQQTSQTNVPQQQTSQLNFPSVPQHQPEAPQQQSSHTELNKDIAELISFD